MAKLAALSATLLARKGQARPAMRPQGFNYPAPVDDLGWNDMGTPAPAPIVVPAPEPLPLPPVLVERAVLEAEVQAPAAAVRPVSVATATRIRGETAHGGKAAFTLRLDADRHLRLRLASAVSGRSAQQLMTQALDALIMTMPEVETLVAQLPAPTRRPGGKK